MVIRFGGIAAKKRPMGRKAANAFKKSLKPSPLKKSVTRCVFSLHGSWHKRVSFVGLSDYIKQGEITTYLPPF
jgi:hypothetical protein